MSDIKELVRSSLAAAMVGNKYHWEPTKPFASEWIQVAEVKWSGEEICIDSYSLDSNGDPTGESNWNEFSRFIEAVTINDIKEAS